MKAGKVRGLGVTSEKPFAAIPGLAPLAAMGVPGYHFELWWGMLAPPKTPEALVDEINAEVNRIIATPGMAALFAREAAEPAPLTAQAFAASIRREIEDWKKVARQAGIRAE